MKGDVSGVKCYRYHRGRDGLGTCNTSCSWWPTKDGEKLKVICPYWIPPEIQGTEKDIPKDEKGNFMHLTFEEFGERYNTEIVIQEEGDEPVKPPCGVLVTLEAKG